jgi:predicted PurR-regulated permease PerM
MNGSPDGGVRRSHLYWHLIFFGLVLGIVFIVLHGLQQVLTPIAAALVLSYLLDPIVSFFERRLRVPRWAGSILVFVLALLLATAVLLVVVPVVVREIHSFAEEVPGYVTKVRGAVVPWIERTFHVVVPGSLAEIADKFGADLRSIASKAIAPIGGVAGRVALEAASLFSTLMVAVLVPIFTFYFLPHFPAILRAAEDLIPRRHLDWVRETARDVNRALAAWIRGQITVMGAQAMLYSIGLTIVGIKMSVLIGVITGFLAFIPYVGVVIGLTLAVFVTALEYTGPSQLIGVGIVFGSVLTIDGLFLTPYLVGGKVGLGPVGVLLALMLGGHLFGFVGVLLAVPAAAALVVVLKRALASYRSSHYYRHGGPADQELG